MLAEANLDRKLRRVPDVPDVVQQTLLRATAALPDVRDASPEGPGAWLRQILTNVIRDERRRHGRGRRDVARERSLGGEVDRSSRGLEAGPAADRTLTAAGCSGPIAPLSVHALPKAAAASPEGTDADLRRHVDRARRPGDEGPRQRVPSSVRRGNRVAKRPDRSPSRRGLAEGGGLSRSH